MARSPFRPLLTWRPPAKLGRGGPPEPVLPTITVTGGTITPFSHDGVDYIEILWRQGGSFEVSADVDGRLALAAGGATGARTNNNSYTPGGGGAGGLIERIDHALVSGLYTVEIGAGAPRMTSGNGAAANGSASTLIGPDGPLTAIGGGLGASFGAGMTVGGDGGSGGGGRGRIGASSADPGDGIADQGHSGGHGYFGAGGVAPSGGGGGAGGQGGDATADEAGAPGPGRYLDWVANPRTVCRGGQGWSDADQGPSPDEDWGNGSRGAVGADVGKGGDGFLSLVVRADQVNLEMAA